MGIEKGFKGNRRMKAEERENPYANFGIRIGALWARCNKNQSGRSITSSSKA